MSGETGPIALDLTFDLPDSPEAVFRAWTTEEEILVWWGEDGAYRTKAWRADVRAGGSWRAEFEGAGGEGFSAEGLYLEVMRPGRLVWTWRADWAPDDETTVEMDFAPSGEGTVMSIRQTGFSDASELADNEAAWRQLADRLAERLAASSP
jgi:uncharacterized protein YndB with AHSA1/START domain